MKKNAVLNGTYFGRDADLVQYPVATEEIRKECGYGGFCHTCMYGIAAGLDYTAPGEKAPQRCRRRKLKEGNGDGRKA